VPAVVGARFGRYELVARIGAGGMGEVFRARDHDLQRDVAVKFLPARFTSDPVRLSRFAQEARAASSLSHPNIVTIHEIGEAFGQPFIVMEFVDGVTLRHEIEHGPMPPKRAIDYAAQIAEGLSKAHAAGIVHRDLKPENIMVSRDGFAKILDFGLAKLRHDGEGDPPPGQRKATGESVTRGSPETSDGTILGTTGYMSPEQAAGRAAGYQSDQFSLGAILYEMATGTRAFARATSVQTLAAIIEQEPEPLQDLNPAFPVPARWIVERCLAKQPADRYASTLDLAHELRGLREHFSEAASGSGSASGEKRARPARRGWRRLWPVAAVVLAALVGVLAVPRVNEAVRTRLGLLPLPAEKRVAVLPVACRGGLDVERKACEGMLDFLVMRLGELERYQHRLAVLPAVDIRQSGVTTADGARTRLNATMAVQVTVEQQGNHALLGASLIDTARLTQLRGITKPVATSEVSLLDEAVKAVVHMLELELDANQQAALRAGGSSVASAVTLYAQALQASPYVTARTALEKYDQQNSLEQAITYFNQALEQDPRFALAHAGLGEAYLRLYRLTKRPEHLALAEQHCQRALGLDKLVGQVWQTLGNLHTEGGRADEALQDFDQALARNPLSAEIYRDRAQTYLKLDRPEDAERAYLKAIELQPASSSIFSYYGAFLYRLNRYPEAEAAFKQGLQLTPESPRLWSSLGATYYAQRRQADAEAAFTRSMSIYPSGVAASNLGTVMFDKGEYSAAARAFEKATSLSPRDFRLWRNLGAAYYWAAGERDRAESAYRTAMDLGGQERQIDPTNGRTVVELADCAVMLGDLAKARTLVDEALRLAPGDSEVHYRAADVFETLGNRDAALRWLGEALRAGRHRSDLERSPSFAHLRADPRYAKLIASLPPEGGTSSP
jgi:serine/threonine-protein kinase